LYFADLIVIENDNEKISRILLDYNLYLYAKMLPINLQTFYEKYFMIIQDYKYPKEISDVLTLNPNFFKNDKLILSNEKLIHQLKYNLQYHLLYYPLKMNEIKTTKFLPNFYKKPSDFSSDFIYYIFAFNVLIDASDKIYLNNISIEETLKYNDGYWYNKTQLPSSFDCPFRFLRIDTIEKGILYTYFWNKYGYLPSYDVDIDSSHYIIVEYIDGKWNNDNPSLQNNVYIIKNELLIILFLPNNIHLKN
jgi:hypothetical protein